MRRSSLIFLQRRPRWDRFVGDGKSIKRYAAISQLRAVSNTGHLNRTNLCGGERDHVKEHVTIKASLAVGRERKPLPQRCSTLHHSAAWKDRIRAVIKRCMLWGQYLASKYATLQFTALWGRMGGTGWRDKEKMVNAKTQISSLKMAWKRMKKKLKCYHGDREYVSRLWKSSNHLSIAALKRRDVPYLAMKIITTQNLHLKARIRSVFWRPEDGQGLWPPSKRNGDDADLGSHHGGSVFSFFQFKGVTFEEARSYLDQENRSFHNGSGDLTVKLDSNTL